MTLITLGTLGTLGTLIAVIVRVRLAFTGHAATRRLRMRQAVWPITIATGEPTVRPYLRLQVVFVVHTAGLLKQIVPDEAFRTRTEWGDSPKLQHELNVRRAKAATALLVALDNGQVRILPRVSVLGASGIFGIVTRR